MYTEYFNLSSKPFQPTPDPEFLFLSESHKKAINCLNYGILDRAGFILLTGLVGTGKTIIVRQVLENLPSDVLAAQVFNTTIDSNSLIAMILDEFEIDSAGGSKFEILRALNNFLVEQYSNGRQCVLIVDEAQNLSDELLEEIRLLSNLESNKAKLLQIILVGGIELDQRLANPELERIAQRITLSCRVETLKLEEAEPYVRHRLSVAGNANAVNFETGSMEEIQRYSGGRPRLINKVMDCALLSASCEKTRTISVEAIKDITEELDNKPLPGDIRTCGDLSEINRLEDKISKLETAMGGISSALLEKIIEVQKNPENAQRALASFKLQLKEILDSKKSTPNEHATNVRRFQLEKVK